MTVSYLIAISISFLIVLFSVPVIRRFSVKYGFLDTPSPRKIHLTPVPLGGGVAIFISFIFTAVVLLTALRLEFSGPIIGIICGSLLIFIVGLCDDYFELSPLTKLLGQIMAALIFLSFVDNPSPMLSPWSYFLFAAVWIVAIQNALNFLDNMDGLCSGISLAVALGFAVLFNFKEMPDYALLSFGLAGAALGFLRYNLFPAGIFLGDSGSLLFGYILSCLSIIHLNSSMSYGAALGALMILAYPAFDLVFVTITRLNEDRKVYIGGKDHSSHRLNIMGISKKNTVYIIYLINALLVVLGITIYLI